MDEIAGSIPAADNSFWQFLTLLRMTIARQIIILDRARFSSKRRWCFCFIRCWQEIQYVETLIPVYRLSAGPPASGPWYHEEFVRVEEVLVRVKERLYMSS